MTESVFIYSNKCLVSHKLDYSDTNVGLYSGAKNWYAIDLKVKPAKDVSVTGSYVKSDADLNLCNWVGKGHADKDYAVKIEYKGTDLNKVGSYGLYAKWVNHSSRVRAGTTSCLVRSSCQPQ